MVKFQMSITVGCDDEGEGGTSVPLPYSAVLIPDAVVDGKTALERILEGAVAEQGGGNVQQIPNPNWKPNALTPEEQGTQFLPAPQRGPEECLALSLRGKLMALHQQTVDREADAKKVAEAAQKAQALQQGVKVV